MFIWSVKSLVPGLMVALDGTRTTPRPVNEYARPLRVMPAPMPLDTFPLPVESVIGPDVSFICQLAPHPAALALCGRTAADKTTASTARTALRMGVSPGIMVRRRGRAQPLFLSQ